MVYRYHALLVSGTVYYRPNLAAYSMAIVLMIAPIAFLRQVITFDARPVHWIRKIWNPQGKEARGARGIVLVFGILSVLGLFNVLLIFRLSHTIYNAAMSIGILIALWLFASTYINFIPGKVSIQLKLSVLSMTLYLALLGTVGWFIVPAYIATFRANLQDFQTLRFTPADAGGYTVEQVDFAYDNQLGERVAVQALGWERNYRIDVLFRFSGMYMIPSTSPTPV